MQTEYSLEDVAQEVAQWRDARQSQKEDLPVELMVKIEQLSKIHKQYHLAKALHISAARLDRALNHIHDPAGSKKTRYYSSEEKWAYYQKWKQSGQTYPLFCKDHRVSESSLRKWSHEFSASGRSRAGSVEDWLEVKSTEPPPVGSTDHVVIEFVSPHAVTARMTVLKKDAVPILKEWHHAIAAVR